MFFQLATDSHGLRLDVQHYCSQNIRHVQVLVQVKRILYR